MFDDNKVEITSSDEARKVKLADEDAWKILAAAKEILVGRGKKTLTYDPKKDPKEDILKACLGRTGNLRAPTLKIGDRLIVGYNDEMYSQHLG